MASVEEILNLNILQAALLSMKRAINKLSIKPELILIDGIFAPKGIKNFKTIINGDENVQNLGQGESYFAIVDDSKFIRMVIKLYLLISQR